MSSALTTRLKKLAVFTDFDGTICMPDSSEYLLAKFGTPRWLEIEQEVWQGRLTEKQAFPLQLETLTVAWPQARLALREGVRVREGFKAFADYCADHQIPLTVLSSGLRNLIEDILAEEQIRPIPVFCHDVKIENEKWKFIPYAGERLEDHCSHCKCVHLEKARLQGYTIVYIGDGYTDFCPSRRADIVFATDALATAMSAEHRPFHPFETFYDIERMLDAIVQIDQESIS
jgi:2-hydroxy-3-keto-5-methylthiopentenyl-1-phosphate phosphatase